MLRQIFSEQGIPKVVRSDNGPHYSGQAFQDFARELGFQHVTSSPHYPRSNGFIESQVKSVKAALRKAKTTHSDPDMALLCLRTTPIDHKLPSPAELLLGRAIQDNLPRKIPRDALNEVVTPRLEERLPALKPGQRVSIQDQTTLKWKPAEVREKLAGVPRSYAVSTLTGRELRRTRTHIRPAPQSNIEVKPDTDEQAVVQDAPFENQAAAFPGSYVTRSGRISKPP